MISTLGPRITHGGGKRRGDGRQHDNAISALHRKRPSALLRQAVAKGQSLHFAPQKNSSFFAVSDGLRHGIFCCR